MKSDVAGAPAARGPQAALGAWRTAWLGLDENPRALAFTETRRGTVLVHLVFFALLVASPRVRLTILLAAVATLTLCALWPARRTLVLGLSGLVLFVLRPFRTEELEGLPISAARQLGIGSPPAWLVPLVVVLVLALLAGWLTWQARRPKSVLTRRPVLWLAGLFFGVTALASAGFLAASLRASLWTVVAVLASGFWFMAYALADKKAKEPSPDLLRLGYLRTFWGGTTTPFGKGLGYLRKFEARTGPELARARLKALKLGTWALLLAFLHVGLTRLFEGELGLATLRHTLQGWCAGEEPSIARSWACLVVHYGMDLLHLAAFGHTLIAMVRMAGYGIPRNSVRPLSARTLAEFWNRYYFYFKELLVDFFFFPAFLRYFKRHPRLRTAFATLCAAGFGNFLYHFMREIHLVASLGPLGALRAFQSYAFYTLVLATGLILSQLRAQRPRADAGFWRHSFWPRVNVALFFCLLQVFDDTAGEGTLSQRLAFLAHLAGLR